MEEQFLESAIIKECREKYPEALSDVEAVGLMARAVCVEMRVDFQTKGARNHSLLSAKYHFLNELRKSLDFRNIEAASSFAVKSQGGN